MRVITLCLLATFATAAQTVAPALSMTDPEKMADALRAGPKFITKDATLLDWPSSPGGDYRVLRGGSFATSAVVAVIRVVIMSGLMERSREPYCSTSCRNGPVARSTSR